VMSTQPVPELRHLLTITGLIVPGSQRDGNRQQMPLQVAWMAWALYDALNVSLKRSASRERRAG
jgi:hypothetical protein